MLACDRQRFLAKFSDHSGVAVSPARQRALTFRLDSRARDRGVTSVRELADALATSHWVTWRTFSPVKERRTSEARNPRLFARPQPDWPSGYYPGGHVQFTWGVNDREALAEVGR